MAVDYMNPQKVSTPTMSSYGLMGKLGTAAGTAGTFLSGASSFLGPAGIGLQIGNMLHGAWKAGEQARKQIAQLDKKADTIKNNLVLNSSKLRDDLKEVDIETQEQQTLLGEDIGEKLEDASTSLGQTIRRGRGLLTGHAGLQKQEIIDDTGRYAEGQIERLNTQRGQQYAGLTQPYQQYVSQSQQSLLDIASQQKQLRKKDSFWENLV